MDRVGHSDPKTTLSIYSHTTVNMKEIINKQTAPFRTGIKQKAFDVKAFSVTIMTPAGIEPATTPQEGVVISIELRGLSYIHLVFYFNLENKVMQDEISDN